MKNTPSRWRHTTECNENLTFDRGVCPTTGFSKVGKRPDTIGRSFCGLHAASPCDRVVATSPLSTQTQESTNQPTNQAKDWHVSPSPSPFHLSNTYSTCIHRERQKRKRKTSRRKANYPRWLYRPNGRDIFDACRVRFLPARLNSTFEHWRVGAGGRERE